jgi:hypothetical protein
MQQRQPRVLFFTKSAKPTDKEVAKAQSLSSNVGFRFAAGAKKGFPAENCDAVAGVNVPDEYRAAGKPYVKNASDLNQALNKAAYVEEDANEEPTAEPGKTGDNSNPQGGWGTNPNGGGQTA